MPNTTDPLISIVVPVYNVEKYISKCIDSILNQTYQNIEVILVDDGSTDRCPEMCDSYERQDSRVKVIHQTNAGLSAARNTGIDIAAGEYIGFVDSDDSISDEMYEVLYSTLRDKGADMSICNYLYMGEHATDYFDNSDLPIQDEVLTGIEVTTQKLSANKNWYWSVACNKLYSRELFSDIRYPVGKLHEDEFVIHKLLLKCKSVACVSKALYFYLQRNSGITKSTYSVRRLDSAEAHFERAVILLSHGIDARFAYHACSAGLFVMANSYQQLSFQDPSYKKRYDELGEQYRNVARQLLKTELPIIAKARLILNCMSPYFTWKFLERFLRNVRDRRQINSNEVREISRLATPPNTHAETQDTKGK